MTRWLRSAAPSSPGLYTPHRQHRGDRRPLFLRGRLCFSWWRRHSASHFPQAPCPLLTWPLRPLPRWRRRARTIETHGGPLCAPRSLWRRGADGISMAAATALPGGRPRVAAAAAGRWGSPPRGRRRENAPSRLLLPASCGQGQLRGGEPGAAPAGQQAGSEGLRGAGRPGPGCGGPEAKRWQHERPASPLTTVRSAVFC